MKGIGLERVLVGGLGALELSTEELAKNKCGKKNRKFHWSIACKIR